MDFQQYHFLLQTEAVQMVALVEGGGDGDKVQSESKHMYACLC
jgi:hypothetical protein